MCKEKLAIKGTIDFEAAASLLEELAASYRKKSVCVEQGEQCVCLTAGDYVDLEVEASVKKGKQKLSIELAWKEELLSDEAKVRISATVPDAKLVTPEAAAAKSAGPVAETKESETAEKKCAASGAKSDAESAAKPEGKAGGKEEAKAKEESKAKGKS